MSSKQPSKKLSRREFLVGVALATTAGVVSACAPAATTAPTQPPAAATQAPAAAATAAPATKAPAAVATAVPATKAPVATTAATKAPAMGSSLIGKLEGPTVVTDFIPVKFNEAPDLADLVKAGKLPPVADRVGKEPIVIKPLKEIGKYGGVWRRAFTGPGDKFNGWRAATGPDGLLYWDYTATNVIPNIAKAYEVSQDGKNFTFRLRKGAKWSDGELFTADDIMFWYNDLLLNKDITPTPTTYMAIGGKYGTVEKIDDLTVVFKFPEPYWMFPQVVASVNDLHGQAAGITMGSYQCAHYLKAFHAKYVAKEELDKKVAAEKFDNWVNLLKFKADWSLNPDLPVMTPWKTTSPISKPQWILERNPYSVWVDNEGNQLPYIDKVVMTLAENLEVLNLRAVAGEIDFQARHISLSKLPVLIQNQEKGNYKVALDIGQYGADLVIWVNFWYDKDPFIGDLLRNTDFRRAVSMAINRDELNETFWLGTGQTGNGLPGDDNKYSPGPGWRKKWANYDVKAASDLLDKLGLSKKDAQGFRLRPDGKRLTVEILTKGGQFLEFTRMAEMIKEHWAKVGIETTVKEVERNLGYTMEGNNETQFSLWTNDGSDDFFLWTASGLPTVFGGFLKWFNSFGKDGTEPLPSIKKMTEIFWKGFGTPEKERIEMGKEFWKIYGDELIQIGVVGLGAASMGVRVYNVNLGNIPARQYDTPWVRNPSISRPQTFFWKK
jgi:peptide/nickel transport system substrate-binding protein